MIREKYESLAVHDLKEIAKARGIKGLSTMKKADVIDAMLRLDAQENAEIKTERSVPENRPAERKDAPEKDAAERRGCSEEGRGRAQGCAEEGRGRAQGCSGEGRSRAGGCSEEGAAERKDTPEKGAVEKQDPHDGGTEPESRAGDRGGEGRQQRTGKRFISNGSYHNSDGQEAATTMVRGKILQLQRPVLLRLWQKRHRTV